MAKADAYDSLHVLTASDVEPFIADCFADRGDGYQIAVPMLYGAPGVGKSSLIAQIAEKHGYAVLDVRLAQVQPEFLSGIQYVSDDKRSTVSLKPSIIERVESLRAQTHKPVILLCDELTLAPADTLSAALEVLLDKRAAGFELPRDTRVIAAGNRTTDTSSAMVLDPPVRSRLASVILETTPEEVAAYISRKFAASPLVSAAIAWLTGSNAKAHFSRTRMVGDEATFFTPRGLEQGLRLADKHVTTLDGLEQNAAAALRMSSSVGSLVWGQICAFAALMTTVKPANEVLANPAAAQVPGTTEGFIAQMGAIQRHVSGMLPGKARDKAVKSVADYLERVAATKADAVRVWAIQISRETRDLLCNTVKADRVLSECGASGSDLAGLAGQARGGR